MNPDPHEPQAANSHSVLPLQIVYAAILLGMATFGVVALMLQEGVSQQVVLGSHALWLMRCIAAGVLAAGIVVPALLSQAGHSRICAQAGPADEQAFERQLFQLYSAVKIVAAAVPEGAGLLLGVAGLLSGNRVDVALMGVPAVVILLRLPTQGGWDLLLRSGREEFQLRRPGE